MNSILEAGQRVTKLGILACLIVFGAAFPHAVVLAMNASFDPYAILYRSKTDQLASYNCGETREFKPYWMRDARYQSIAIGSSRVNMGVDPALDPQLNLFNAGAPSGDLYEIRRFLQDVKYLPNYKTVFVFLDLSMFDANDGNLSYFSEGRMLSKADGSPTPPFLNWLDVFGKTAEAAPLIDVALGLCPSYNVANGFRAPEYVYTPKLWYERAMDTYISYYSDKFDYAETGENSVRDALPHIRDVIQSRRDVKFYFVFSPLHWIINSAVFREGQSPAFFDYRRKLVEGLADLPNVQTWEFAVASPATTSVVPKSDGEWKGGFYKEPSHFAPRLGKIVIDEVLTGHEQYGRRVTPANLSQVFEQLKASHDRWEASWPDINYYNDYYQMLLRRIADLKPGARLDGI